MFHRILAFLSIIVTFWQSTRKVNVVLVRLGFKAIDSDLSLKDRLKFGLFISIFVYFGTLLIMISIT